MPIITPKIILYHIPKCGGIYAKEALRRGLYHPETDYGGRPKISGVKNDFGLYREHATPDGTHEQEKRGRLSICFVRHPITWYSSFWSFRIKTKSYSAIFPLDDLVDDDYETFVGNVLREFPNGFVTQLFQCYVGADLSKVNFIGKQENLTDDLVEALVLSGQEFSEKRLRQTKWHNMSGSSKAYKELTVLNEDTKNKVLKAEEWVINTFYSDV